MGTGPLESSLRAHAHELGLDDDRAVPRLRPRSPRRGADPRGGVGRSRALPGDRRDVHALCGSREAEGLSRRGPSHRADGRAAERAGARPERRSGGVGGRPGRTRELRSSRVLSSPAAWQESASRALAYARRFDWPVLLRDLLAKLVSSSAEPGPGRATNPKRYAAWLATTVGGSRRPTESERNRSAACRPLTKARRHTRARGRGRPAAGRRRRRGATARRAARAGTSEAQSRG